MVALKTAYSQFLIRTVREDKNFWIY